MRRFFRLLVLVIAGLALVRLTTILFTYDTSSGVSPKIKTSSWVSFLGGLMGHSRYQKMSDDGDSLDNHIKMILVPRVSGTPGNVEVREYIINELKENSYHIELDQFVDSTPIGNVEFTNIIASSNPKACRQLVLACHYDSKMMDNFLGATDSAVPCAMLLNLSETFKKSFRDQGESSNGQPDKQSLGLKFIFFDGEEAFLQWTRNDSLYGSRHLATKWAKKLTKSDCAPGSGRSELDKIELFILLDLIGVSDTSFVMYSLQTRHHYEALQAYEREYLEAIDYNHVQGTGSIAFTERIVPIEYMEDDHVPFKERGVPILLLLAHPFPKVWHTDKDNYEVIDFLRTRRILHTIEKFIANYPNNRR